MMLNPWIALGALAALAATAYSSYQFGIATCQGREALAREVAAEAVDSANAVIGDNLSKLTPKYTTIKNEVQREVRTNTVYADCKVPPLGVELVNRALEPGTAASAAPAPRVPASSVRQLNEALRGASDTKPVGGS